MKFFWKLPEISFKMGDIFLKLSKIFLKMQEITFKMEGRVEGKVNPFTNFVKFF